MGEVAAVLLWILFGVVAIALLGLVCSWVLKARGGLEVMHYAEPDVAALAKSDAIRIKADARANAMHSRRTEQNTYGGF